MPEETMLDAECCECGWKGPARTSESYWETAGGPDWQPGDVYGAFGAVPCPGCGQPELIFDLEPTMRALAAVAARRAVTP